MFMVHHAISAYHNTEAHMLKASTIKSIDSHHLIYSYHCQDGPSSEGTARLAATRRWSGTVAPTPLRVTLYDCGICRDLATFGKSGA